MTHARYPVERRRSRRVPVSGCLRFQYSRQEGGHGELVNADLGGICLRTMSALEPGQSVMMELLADDGSTIAELKGRVVWTGAASSDGAEYGIRVYGHDWDAQQTLCALVSRGIASHDVIRWFAVRLPGAAGWRQSAAPGLRNTRRVDDAYAPGFAGHLVSGL